MATAKKYSIEGKELGELEIDNRLAEAEANGQMIKDYIVALRANARQWSASTKGRSEVKHTTKKPHRQKGTGNARQGSLVSPQYRGGGIVFGPKPKFDQHVRINRKERRAAVRSLIGEKIRDGKLHIIESTSLEAPKTKTVAGFLDACPFGKRVLFLGEGNFTEVEIDDTKKAVSVCTKQHGNFQKSLKNIQKTEFSLAKNISGYDVILANDIVMTEAALAELTEWLL